MKSAVFLHITFILIWSIFSVSCDKKFDASKRLEIYKNILEDYEIMEKITPTNEIDFTSNESRKYLLNGWSHIEKTHTWSEGSESSLLFYSLDNLDDKKLSVTCSPIYKINYPKQKMDIFLNDMFVDSTLLDNKIATYHIRLPRKQLKAGKNILGFKYRYTVNPDGPDERNLAVMFKTLSFYPANSGAYRYEKVNEECILRQYPNSLISYYLDLPENAKIVLKYLVHGNLNPIVRIELDGEDIQEITLSLQKSISEKTLYFKKKKLAKISLLVFSEEKAGSVEWHKIDIYSSRKNSKMTSYPHVETIQARGEGKTNHKPDILIYVVDALRSDYLSCYGYTRETSPNLDTFSKNNSLFINAYANASWTRPSAATMLTGLLAKNHKTMSRESSLPEDLQTLPEILRNNGYHTVAFITNGNICSAFSFDQGFDEFIYLPEDMLRESVHVRSDELNRYVFAFLDRFLKRKNRKPFFALIWSTDPHNPYTPDGTVSKKFEIDQYEPVDNKFGLDNRLLTGSLCPSESQLNYIKTLYGQEIFFNDRSFGNLLRKLQMKNLYEDSIIIFTADHGEEFRDHGGYRHGFTLYNEVIKIPLVFKLNGMEKGVIRVDVQHADLVPTILDSLNIAPPYKLDGKSLLKLDSLGKRRIISQEQLALNDLYSVLYDGNKLIHNIESFRPPRGRGVIPRFELYNNEKDTGEKSNLANAKDLKRGYLMQMLKSWEVGKNKVPEVRVEKAIIPPQLDRKLRDLGYVR